MLLAMLVDREALEVDVPAGAELGLHGPGDVDGRLEAQVRHAVFDHLEVDGDDARHFDGAAEADLPVSLGEVKIADGKLRPRHVDGQVNLAAAAQVLDTVFPLVKKTPRQWSKTSIPVQAISLTRNCLRALVFRGPYERLPGLPFPWSWIPQNQHLIQISR